MRNSKLKEEYMKEESFWHVTNKKNLESIDRFTLEVQHLKSP